MIFPAWYTHAYMKILLFITLSLLFCRHTSYCQDRKNLSYRYDSSIARQYKPEIFTNGFIDIMNNGQVNASARFIRLFIGEPGKFSFPLSVYGGVSANNFQNNSSQPALRNNDHLINNYINPLSGLINLSVDGVLMKKRAHEKLTRIGMLYQVGERVLTGIKNSSGQSAGTDKTVNFLNTFSSMGIYFQSGAWERNNTKDLGIFWIALRFIGCYSNPNQIRDFLPGIETNGIYFGYSPAFGIEINNLVNIKAIYYKYSKKPELSNTVPIYQFSFNYSFRK